MSGIVGAGLLVPYILYVPETRAGPILARRARHLRKTTGNTELYAAHEAFGHRSMREIAEETLLRPLQMLFREPIVYVLAIWDGLNVRRAPPCSTDAHSTASSVCRPSERLRLTLQISPSRPSSSSMASTASA